MEARRRTWFDDAGLNVGARRIPCYAGAMHYWRVDPTRWAACLAELHSLGLTIVETYVPWRVHEPEAGRYELTGRNDLARFLALAQAAGLHVILRPGPHVNAELTSFGFPDHVISDPDIQARTSRGTPVWMPSPPRAWPVPSYASATFHARVKTWYAKVAEIAAPHLAPDGPVVAIGVDNEAQLFFRTGAFDADYHPDAIAWWREASGMPGDPPRAWDAGDPARGASWVRFKDVYLARALGTFAAALDEVGFAGLARFHNLPPGHHGGYELRGIQAAIGGPVGIDAYTPRTGFRELRRRATAVVGIASPLPLALEVGVGFFPWFPPLDSGDDPARERDQLLVLLAAGVRGFNLFMAVERDRYYGAAISSAGKLEPHAGWIRTLVTALAEVEWPALRRARHVAVVDARADARFGIASSLLDPMTPVLAEVLNLGPGGAAELGTDPAAIAARRWQPAIVDALELAQAPYAIVEETTPEDELAGYRAVIVPTPGRIDRALYTRLRALAEARRTIVVLGPELPVRDELDQPLADPGAGSESRPLQSWPAPRRLGRLKPGSLAAL
ncbi:MAG: alpha-amylase family protein, partial [Kofleriaceae bacterium]